MKDWFGNEYVASSWTRFVMVWQLVNFTARRNNALRGWLENLCKALQTAQVGASVDILLDLNQLSGGNLYGVVINTTTGASAQLGLWHYDTLTKEQLDPIKYVLAVWRSKQ